MSGSSTQWLDPRAAAQHCACSVTTLLRAARRGELKAYKLAQRRAWRFAEADLDEWMRRSAQPLPFVPRTRAS